MPTRTLSTIAIASGKEPVWSESIEMSLNEDNKSKGEEEAARPLGTKDNECAPSAKAALPA